jgi:2-keto-4-pentenoate hydratase/2-oxohepta-3-ene-1,7-dioic acid hydratase in catechol pathway
MKICRYSISTDTLPQKRLGIITEDNILIDPNFCWQLDLEREGHNNIEEKAEHILSTSLSKILKLSLNPIEDIESGYALYLFFLKVGINELSDGTPISYDLRNTNNISFHAPLDKITSYRDFYAHEKHVKVGFDKRNEPVPPAWYEIPAYYKGATEGFIGPEDEIMWPSYTDVLDYELELAVVIGRDGQNINEEDAADHIFGYTILNDISARDIQKKEMAVRLGPAKGKDFCSVIGPVIITADEFDFKEPNLKMTAKINGKKWSEGMSGDSHYSWAQMITHIAKDEWLMAGDLLGSGTVGTGCGLELDKWIKEGDVIELHVDSIGTLKNKIGKKRGQNGKL